MNIFKGIGGSGHNKVAGKTSSDGIPHIGFGDKKKEDSFGVMVSESRKLFLNPDKKNIDGFIRTCFKTMLDWQSGNGKNTHKACRELAKDMLATCQKIQDPNRKLEILKALESLQTDTSMQSKQGDSLATICLFDPGSLDALRIQRTAEEADIVRAGPSRPNRTASATNSSNNATLAQWSQSQVPVVSGSSTVNNPDNHGPEDMVDHDMPSGLGLTSASKNKEDVPVKIGFSTKATTNAPPSEAAKKPPSGPSLSWGGGDDSPGSFGYKKLSASSTSYERTDSERDRLVLDDESEDYTPEKPSFDTLTLAEVQASLKDTNNGILKIIEAQSGLDTSNPVHKELNISLKAQREQLKETSDLLKRRKKELETADISGLTGALNSTADNTAISSAAPFPAKANIYSQVIAAANKQTGYEETKTSGNLDVNVASSNTPAQLAKDHEAVSVKLQIAEARISYLNDRMGLIGSGGLGWDALDESKSDVLAEMKSLKIQKRALEESNPALKLKTYAVVVSPDFSADTYPNVQRSSADVGVFSMPSDHHTHENHDRAKVFMLGETRVTLVCDGVSNCGESTNGTQITGEAAADSVSDGVKSKLAADSEIEDLIDNFSERVKAFKGDLSSPKAKETVSQNLNNIRSKITKKLNAISEKITPKASATTFEMSFEIAAAGKKFLVSFSVGDSQSLVYNKDTHAITQLNAKMYSGTDDIGSSNIYFADDLVACDRPFKSTSDPLGTISGTHVLEANDISVTLCELVPGDVVITASDGLTDAFAEMRGSTTKVDQTQLSEFMQDCGDASNEELAQRLAQESNSITKKPDDITVCVHRVVLDNAVTMVRHTVPHMTAGNVSVPVFLGNRVASTVLASSVTAPPKDTQNHPISLKISVVSKPASRAETLAAEKAKAVASEQKKKDRGVAVGELINRLGRTSVLSSHLALNGFSEAHYGELREAHFHGLDSKIAMSANFKSFINGLNDL